MAPTVTTLITWPGFDRDGVDTGRRLIAAGHELRMAPFRARRTRQELVALVDGVDAAIVSTDPLDASILDRASRLRVIARVGVGTDSIDMAAAARNDIAVCTTPGANTETTADHTLALMLAVLRRVPEHHQAVREGRWDRTGGAIGWELHGATVGLVGCGAIGRAVARRLDGFGVRLLVCDPHAEAPPQAEPASLERLLRMSDVVSLHLPLTAATEGLMDRRRLGLLAPHAVLVNAARGGLVDEDALVDVLERGALRGAGLDVLALEPPGPSRLLALPNVVVSPHVAGLSVRSVEEMTRRATDAVLDALAGRVPAGLVANAPGEEVTHAWTR
jgi:phosphoglycerate dehydrogenase-like enzyme